MPYKSHFEYVEELPSGAEKVESLRCRTPIELYYDYPNNKFYTQFFKPSGEVKRIRVCNPSAKGLIFTRTVEGDSIYIHPHIFRREYEKSHGLPFTESFDLDRRIKNLEKKIDKLRQMKDQREQNSRQTRSQTDRSQSE